MNLHVPPDLRPLVGGDFLIVCGVCSVQNDSARRQEDRHVVWYLRDRRLVVFCKNPPQFYSRDHARIRNGFSPKSHRVLYVWQCYASVSRIEISCVPRPVQGFVLRRPNCCTSTIVTMFGRSGGGGKIPVTKVHFEPFRRNIFVRGKMEMSYKDFKMPKTTNFTCACIVLGCWLNDTTCYRS